jgi:protocatechuate 3,4-dioxygenase beta subunit
MERKHFLKNGLAALGLVAVAPLMKACKKEDATSTTGSSGTGSCTVMPTETEGPFPTKSPSTYQRANIVEDRTGVPLTINLIIKNTNNSCAVVAGAIVDIWHCDREGNYSEYGGTGMQSTDYTGAAYNFLRGRLISDASGLVSFTSLYPGWYSGRAPHIHVHIYNASGVSKLITQIAFPKDICDIVYTTSAFYSSKGVADTLNSNDNVFGTPSTDLAQEIADSVTGTVSGGYILTKLITAAF